MPEKDMVVFLVLKKALTKDIEDLVSLNLDRLFDREYEDEPDVLVYHNFNKCYNWTILDDYVKQFYDNLGYFSQEDFVFMRVGENIDDYEFVGECYCTFHRHMKNHDVEIVRELRFTKK